MLDNSLTGSEMAAPADTSKQSFTSEDDSYNALVIDENDSIEQFDSNTAVDSNTVNIQDSAKVDPVKATINTQQYLQLRTPEINRQLAGPHPIKSLESVVNNLIMSQFESENMLNRNHNNNNVMVPTKYSEMSSEDQDNHSQVSKCSDLGALSNNKSEQQMSPSHGVFERNTMQPIVIQPVINKVTSPYSSSSYSGGVNSPLTSPSLNNTTTKQLKNENHPLLTAAISFALTSPVTSPKTTTVMNNKSATIQLLHMKKEPVSAMATSYSPSYGLGSGYPGTGLHTLPMTASMAGSTAIGMIQGFPMPGLMAPSFSQPAMSPAMMTKTSPVLTSPPSRSQHSHHHTEAPLDLSTSTKRPLVSDKTTNSADSEAPIDLAPKRMKTEQKFLEASEFLQNVVYINITLSEEEKIERYLTLSILYEQITMPRKSAFFKRIAAMQCVAPNNPKPAWLQCYYILLQALDGYRISLDPKDTPIDHTSGWPTTQLRVLHELIYSARKMGNPAIAIRHISYLFHTLFDFLSLDDRRELVGILESYTCRCEGVSQTLALENGLILPPVPFFKFPKVYSFKLQCPPDHLLAKKYQKKKGSNKSALNTSPFIYSPIQFGVKEKASTSKMDFNWVQGEVCTIDVEAKNPLPIELQVNNISLLTEGTGFSVSPCNVTIPPSARARFNIAGTPESTGELAILGYQTNVFGCKSNCRFRDLHHIEESQYNVKVVPSLPKMTLSLSSPWKDLLSGLGIKHGTVSSAVIHVYAGQSCECTVRLKNSGELPIEMIDVQLADKTHNNLLKEILVWNQFNINSQLPIAPGNQASFTLYVNADKNPELAHQASTYNCSLTFQYSGAVGLEAGYCRQCTVDVQLHIEPVVTVHQVQVKQALYSAGHGDIELHLYNNTRHNVLISSQDQVHSQGIASHSVHKLNLQIPKCNITQDMLEEVPFEDHTANENQSFNSNCDNSQLNSLLHTSHVSSQSEGQRHDRIQILTSQIAQHISNFVDLKWKLPDSGVDGKLFVDSSKWDKWDLELLESLIKDPVVFAVSVNGEVHDPVSTPTVTCGEPVSIKCSVTNTSDCDIPDTCIHLWCPHVDDRCTDDHSLPYVIVGQNAGHIKMLKVGCVSSHQWEWLPLCPGVYDITVVVFPLDSQNLDTLNPDTHGTPYPDTQWTLNPDTMTQINLDDPESYPGSRKHGVLMRDSISTLNKRSHDVNQWTSVPITIIVK